MPTLLPMPMPTLTRLHCLAEDEEKVVETFELFIDEYITLLILGNFEKADLLLKNANQLCLQDGAHPKQRVLWIKDVSHIAELRPKLEAFIEKKFPERTIDFNNIRALSMSPKTESVSYLIFVDPTATDEPRDKRKKLSTFQMARAFNAAIKDMPNPELEPDINPEPENPVVS
ncbi:MAG: hypothetical protein AAGI23_06280 [Bacteroidota bacterium]